MSLIQLNNYDKNDTVIDNNATYSVTSAAHVSESGFHKVGVKIEENTSASDLMKKAGLDWNVSKKPIQTSDGVTIQNRYALVRDSDNEPLDIVGKTWEPVQNADMFEFFERVCKDGGLKMHAAGASAAGRHVWAVAELERPINVFKGDEVGGLLAFSLPHVHGKAVTVQSIANRFVCCNQIHMGDSKATMRFAHNQMSKYSPETAANMVIEIQQNLENFKKSAQFLASKPLTRELFISYIKTVLALADPDKGDFSKKAQKHRTRNENKISQVLSLADTMPGARLGQGTLWQAVNAISYLTNHVDSADNAQKQLDSNLTGANQRRNQLALTVALDMAKAA